MEKLKTNHLTVSARIDLYEEKLNEVIDHLNAQSKEEWPQKGDSYYTIDEYGNVYESMWFDHPEDPARRNFIGIFKTKEEAEMRKGAIKLLNRV